MLEPLRQGTLYTMPKHWAISKNRADLNEKTGDTVVPTGYKKRVPVRPFFLFVTGVVVGGTFLLESPKSTQGATPKGIQIGIFRAHPAMTLVNRWDDNVFKTATHQQSDVIAQLEPVIRLVTHWEKNQLTLSYTATVERYGELKGENSANQEAKMDLILVFPARHTTLNFGYVLQIERDKRGSPESSFMELSALEDQAAGNEAIAEPNRWLQHTLNVSTKFKLNRLSSTLKLEHSERRATNDVQTSQDRYWNDGGLVLNWDLAAKTQFLTELGHRETVYDIDPLMDSTESRIMLDIHWQWKPKTQLSTELGHKKFVYGMSPLLDSTESRIMLGINWKVTGKTVGNLKFGSVTKLIENDPKKNSTVVSWDSNISWNPQERTELNFSSHRAFHEGGEQAEHFVSTQLQVDLRHALRPNWSLLSGLDFNKSVFEPIRSESYWNSTLGLEYQMRRWFALNAEFTHQIKHSSVPNAEYDSNGLHLSLTGTL